MNILLTADLHLDDNQLNDYRWDIFEILEKEAQKHNIGLIGILGDTLDRKDRHSGKLVNKFVSALKKLQKTAQVFIVILSGNHDAPLKGVYFWEFLNDYDRISYITKPKMYTYKTKDRARYIQLLPFSSNPEVEWKDSSVDLDLFIADAIFMHQPVEGALIDEKRKLEKAPPIPALPDVPIFSGDIHHQQALTINHKEHSNTVNYIGVPHPVHFNETWKNRIILIKDDDFRNFKEIWIEGTRRAIVEIDNSSELEKLTYKEGDQLRIRYKLTGQNLTNWSTEEQKIRQWAQDRSIHLASLEATIVGEGLKATTSEEISQLEIMSPEQVIQKFCKDEGLSEEIQNIGVQLLKESV